jgi:hypothetical protein
MENVEIMSNFVEIISKTVEINPLFVEINVKVAEITGNQYINDCLVGLFKQTEFFNYRITRPGKGNYATMILF